MLYKYIYRNGKTRVRMFDREEDAYWFAHNEGDSLLEWKKYETNSSTKTPS